MVGNLLTALFSTVGYCLLMNVPVKKIIPASVGGMLSWLLYLLLKDRVQSVFYLLVLVGAFAATYSEDCKNTRDAVPASGAHSARSRRLGVLCDAGTGAEPLCGHAPLRASHGAVGSRSCGWHLRRGGHPPDRAVYAKARRLTGRKSFDSVKRSASRCFYTITRLPLRKGKSGLLPERFMIP